MALVRVKRRLNEDPIDVLLLTCKKQKTDDPSSTVFKFAATVNKEEDVDCRIKEVLNADDQLPQYKRHHVSSYNLTEKLRLDTRTHSKENRLKVINCYRDVDLVPCAISELEEGLPRTLTVVHVENRPPTHGQTRLSEAPTDSNSPQEIEPPRTEEEYVYDLYYCKDGDFDDLQMENMLSAHAVDESLFADYLPQDDEEQVAMDDEDDSNDENNWRNDYPDEDELSGFDEEDDTRLALKMKNISLGECPSEELSSDEEDEDLIYGGEEGRAHYWTVQGEEEEDKEDEDEEYLDDISNSSDLEENIHH